MAKQSKKRTKKPSESSFKSPLKDIKIISILVLIFILIVLYNLVLSSNIKIKSEKYFVYIPAKYSTSELSKFLKKEEVIGNALTFRILADWMDLLPKEKGGLFEVNKDWNNWQLISALKEDRLSPAKILTIPRVRMRQTMISEVVNQLKFDKKKFLNTLRDPSFLSKMNMNKESVYCIFIPGTYYIPDSLDEKECIEVLYGEFEHFFNQDRMDKAQDADLSPEQATILASIIYSETKKPIEMPVIAGVYINRLKKNMRLEADPTLVFAAQDFNARRIYKKKKLIYPEYSTYHKKGLPPGPIHFPPPEVIDLVLDFENHDYIYFCAKDDSTGTHNFAATYEEHKINAGKYRDYLNARKIF